MGFNSGFKGLIYVCVLCTLWCGASLAETIVVAPVCRAPLVVSTACHTPLRILISKGYKYRIYGTLSLRGEVYRMCANTRILNLVLTFTYVASHFKVYVFCTIKICVKRL